MNIPASVQVMGHTITVSLVPPIQWKHADCVGYFDPNGQSIHIKKGRASTNAHVFCHELTHAILLAIGSDKYTDEAFVDSFGGLLAQALDSAKYAAPIRRKRKGNA